MFHLGWAIQVPNFVPKLTMLLFMIFIPIVDMIVSPTNKLCRNDALNLFDEMRVCRLVCSGRAVPSDRAGSKTPNKAILHGAPWSRACSPDRA